VVKKSQKLYYFFTEVKSLAAEKNFLAVTSRYQPLRAVTSLSVRGF
jgi:hypothetical protein